uniref:RNA-directed RNA polymerase L n=1 Tax=avian metapneumovirus TaxID=38525 RepID=A0A481Y580_9MONO|nr:RNA-dependent RNA polymerase [Avian metapneumovirus]
MDLITEEVVNVYLPDSYLKGVISFSETNALGSSILGLPYLKKDNTSHVAIQNPVIEHNRLKYLFNTLKIPKTYNCVEPLMLQNEIMHMGTCIKPHKLKEWLKRAKECSSLRLQMLEDWLQLKNNTDKNLYDCICTDSIPIWVEEWFNTWLILHEHISNYRKMEVSQQGAIYRRNEDKMYYALSSFGCILISKKSKRYTFCTYNQLLTWKDMALSRFNANFCVWVSNCLNNQQEGSGLRSSLSGGLLNKLYHDTDFMLSTTGNECFALVKEFEGFLMSEILHMTEHAQFSLRFRNTLLNGLADKVYKIRPDIMRRREGTVCTETAVMKDDEIKTLLGIILRTIKLLIQSRIENAAELYFIFRIFGHPMVEEREAMDAVKLNNEVTKVLSLKSLTEMRGAFILRIIKGFVATYKRWPRVKNPTTLSRRWQMYRDAKSYPSDLELTLDDYLELAGINFRQEFHIPTKTNLEMVLNDKAISPPKDLIWSVFPKNYLPQNIQDEFRSKCYESKEKNKTRRVLEYYLKDPNFSQEDLKHYVVHQRYLNDRNHVVSLTGKERELSVGRMFAMQPGDQRQVQILAEKMLSDNIVPFFPETLTKYGDLELQRIMELKSELSSTKTRHCDTYNNYIARASIVTDLSKFNQAFRYETTSVCADIADDLHGTQSLFCWLHLTIPMTTVLCTYRHAPPNTYGMYNIDTIPEQSGLYRYHMGGIEGWCQKMWTMEAISLLDVVSVKNRVQLTSLLNGDNQSIDVSKPVRLTANYTEVQADYSLAIQMLREIRDAYKNIGHKLKEGETYVSRDLQFISKIIQSEGVMYPSAIKKILRVGPWINTILDDIKTSMEAIGSLCQELEFRGESILTSTILKNFWLYIQCFVEVKNHSLAGTQLQTELNQTLRSLKLYFKLSSEKKTVNLYLNIPMHLGGGDPVVFYRSFYRRTPDFLTEVISHVSLLLRAAKVDSDITDQFFRSLLNVTKNEKATLTTLMRDPQAIGSERQAKITSDINRTAVTSVLSTAPNQLFSDSALHFSQNEQEIGRVAEGITPTYPHGLRVLYEAFPFYKAEKVVNMISGTKSVTNILQRTSAISGIDIERAVRMMVHNLGLLGRILNTAPSAKQVPKVGDKLLCCKLSQQIREASWDSLEIIGVSSPSMVSCMSLVYTTALEGEGIVIEKFSTERTTRGTRGPKMPWVGSSTQEKKLVPVYNRQILSKVQRDQLETIGKLRWVYKGVTGLRRTLNKICLGTLGLPYKLLKPLLPRFMSVNFLHRLAVSSRPVEFPASIPAYRTTNYHFDTSPINKTLSERFGNEDINLVFQNAISCGVSVMSVVEQLTGRSPKQLVMKPLVEDIDILPPPTFQGVIDHKYVNKIVCDQHIFNPDKITLSDLGKILLPTVQVSALDRGQNYECFFNGTNIVETLSTSLACYWCSTLLQMYAENTIFQKEWGDGFITDHAFVNFEIFMSAFKTYLTCHWQRENYTMITDQNLADKLLRVNNYFWKIMSKVLLTQKVKRRVMIYDINIVNVLSSQSFKSWFIERMNKTHWGEVPWIVNADGDLVEVKASENYLALLNNSTCIKTIMLNYSDMAHAMTRLLRCKNMQDHVPQLTKTISPTDISPVIDPTTTLFIFPKAPYMTMTKFSMDKISSNYTLKRNPMTILPWHHVMRYNSVYSSTGCKLSIKGTLAKLIAKLEVKVIYFVGEGAGHLMARTACEYPSMKFVYRSLKSDDNHCYPIEYARILGGMSRVLDYGDGLSIEATDVTKKDHWEHLHRICKDPLLLTVCDAELKNLNLFMTAIIQWRRHVLSCRICTTYGTNIYLYIKYHAEEVNHMLPHFVKLLAVHIMQNSKLSGSECYVLLGLGHQSKLPGYSEVRGAKAQMSMTGNVSMPIKIDKGAVTMNLRTILPGLKIPITESSVKELIATMREEMPCAPSMTYIGGSRIIERKWVNRKVCNVAKWIVHILNMPKGDPSYDYYEVIENTYPNMMDLLENLTRTEVKKLVKITGYLLTCKK